MKQRLLVNGMGMTKLTPITKMMAHLTLSSLDHTPHSALIICFGMGTTFRSALSWNVSTTAVELVPSVPSCSGFFHSDAGEVRNSPLAHIVIDDGRRYLERSPAKYDAIIIDPRRLSRPPVRACSIRRTFTPSPSSDLSRAESCSSGCLRPTNPHKPP